MLMIDVDGTHVRADTIKRLTPKAGQAGCIVELDDGTNIWTHVDASGIRAKIDKAHAENDPPGALTENRIEWYHEMSELSADAIEYGNQGFRIVSFAWTGNMLVAAYTKA